MPTISITDFNIVCSVLGGFVLFFGLVSYFVKERLYLSEALIALLVGIALGPHGANFIRPLHYASGSESNLESITLAFTRLVLGVQLVLAGVQLPKKYLLKEWRSLTWLLLPIMTGMWLVSSCLIWALIPWLPILPSMAIAACITPTDPILSNSIVKGKFADAHIPVPLQRIIIAESGANDGLGYPFLFAALYFIKYCGIGAPYFEGGVREALGLWFGETMGYTIILSVAYGAIVGWQAKDLLHWAETRRLVDRESFLVFAIALALFIVGTCGMIGTDDVLACFIAGNVFTLDDWFRLETLDDSLQPTVDMLLNISVFLWFGAVLPWELFKNVPGLPLGNLIAIAVLIILLRRLPMVLVLHRFVPRIETFKEGLFAGYFGPIGVSAIFYLYVTLEFFHHLATHISSLSDKEVNGSSNADAENVERIMEMARAVVWVCVLASVVVHGITVPVIKFGGGLPRTLSNSSRLVRTLSTISRDGGGSGSGGGLPSGAHRIPGLGTRIRVNDADLETGLPPAPATEEPPNINNSKEEPAEQIAGPSNSPHKTGELPNDQEEPTLRSANASRTVPSFSPRSVGAGVGLEEDLERIARNRKVKIIEHDTVGRRE